MSSSRQESDRSIRSEVYSFDACRSTRQTSLSRPCRRCTRRPLTLGATSDQHLGFCRVKHGRRHGESTAKCLRSNVQRLLKLPSQWPPVNIPCHAMQTFPDNCVSTHIGKHSGLLLAVRINVYIERRSGLVVEAVSCRFCLDSEQVVLHACRQVVGLR